jgi:hypothetical protein
MEGLKNTTKYMRLPNLREELNHRPPGDKTGCYLDDRDVRYTDISIGKVASLPTPVSLKRSGTTRPSVALIKLTPP